MVPAVRKLGTIVMNEFGLYPRELRGRVVRGAHSQQPARVRPELGGRPLLLGLRVGVVDFTKSRHFCNVSYISGTNPSH